MDTETKTNVTPAPLREVQTTVASTQLLNLMHQLEENGIQVAIGESETSQESRAVDAKNTSVTTNTSIGQKRKRSTDEEANLPKRKLSVVSSTTSTGTTQAPEEQSTPATSVSTSSSQTLVSSATVLPRIVASYSISTETSTQTDSPVVDSNSNHLKATRIVETASPTIQSDTPQKEQRNDSGKNDSKRPNLISSDTGTGKTLPPRNKTKSNEPSKEQLPRPTDLNEKDSSKRNSRSTSLSETRTKSRSKDVSPSIKQINSPSRSGSLTTSNSSSQSAASGELHYLERHLTRVLCIFSKGPCIFSCSEDKIVNVYDMKTSQLSMRILGHPKRVTWLFAFSVDDVKCQSAKSTSEYLKYLCLITGSEDGHVREFSLDSGDLTKEVNSQQALTCFEEYGSAKKLFIGSKQGEIFAYSYKTKSLKRTAHKVCLTKRVLHFR